MTKRYVLTATLHGAVTQPRGSIIELTDDQANNPLVKSRIRPADVELVVPVKAESKSGKKTKGKAKKQADAE